MRYPSSEPRYTVEEYYALDKASDRRWEYWDGEIVCMSGGSKEHAIIQGDVLKHVSNRLKEHCRAFSADLAIKINHQAGYVYDRRGDLSGNRDFITSCLE